MFEKLLAIALLILFLPPTTAMDPDFASLNETHITFGEALLENIDVKMQRLEDVAFRVVSKKQKPPEELERVLRSIFTLHHNDEKLAQVMILSLNQDHLYFLRQIFADEVALQAKVSESLSKELEKMKAQLKAAESARMEEQARLLKLSTKLSSETMKSGDTEGIRLRQQVMEKMQAMISMEPKFNADRLAISTKEAKNKEDLSLLGDIENIVDIFDKILLVRATVDSLGEANKK